MDDPAFLATIRSAVATDRPRLPRADLLRLLHLNGLDQTLTYHIIVAMPNEVLTVDRARVLGMVE